MLGGGTKEHVGAFRRMISIALGLVAWPRASSIPVRRLHEHRTNL